MGRTVIVGDVHGCADELDELLDRLAIDASDRLTFVGDLVMRGPKPREVMARVRALGATCVLGNHEWRLLQWRKLRGEKQRELSPEQARWKNSSRLASLGDQLSDEDWAQLENMPLFQQLPEHNVVVVHAGVVPGRELEQQEPRDLLHMRCLSEDGDAREGRDAGPLWGSRYSGPPHVVFGHNALSEPQLHPWATGIDTGCVYGGRLTALVLNANQDVIEPPQQRRDQLVSVAAHATYVAIRQRGC